MGNVTTGFHNCEEGDIIGVRGPFGNGWPIEKMKGKNIVIIGGGFAFSTLRSLIIYMLDKENRTDYKKITVIYGNRDSGEVLYKKDFENWKTKKDIDIFLTLDRKEEGWKEKVGFV